jgi:glycosyltransferase involved in cell wall biosynthesis
VKRVLIVAYYFPPIGGIGSIRLARFAELLPEFGWEPTVLAPRNTPHARDPHLHFPEDKVIRSRSIELSRAGRVVPGVGSGSGGARASLRSVAHRFVFYPDPQIGWYPGALRAGLRAARRERFDAVYSSSYPITAHLVARTLSRRAGIPWVAEFRDPWSERLPADHPYKRRAARLAAALADSASRVVVPSPTWADHYRELWGKPVDVVMNGHDVDPAAGEPPAHPTVTHVGSYYPGLQDFRALWEAIAGVADRPRMRFVGELPEPVRAELAAYGLEGLAEATGFVPHDEAMKAMQSSSLLIASGFTDDPMSRGVIPAKLFEYLASGLPILYFGDPADDAARLLDGQPGCYVVEPGDVAGALKALEAGLAPGRYERDAERFSRRNGARRLAEVLDDALTSSE